MSPLVVAGEVDALELQVLVVGRREEDAISGGGELGLDAFVDDPDRLIAALQRSQVDPGLHRPERREQKASRDLAVDDAAAVGRETGLDVVAGLLCHDAAGATADGHHADTAQFLVVPGRVDDPIAVAGEAGVELEVIALIGETALRTAGQVLDVDMPQGLEHGLAAVW